MATFAFRHPALIRQAREMGYQPVPGSPGRFQVPAIPGISPRRARRRAVNAVFACFPAVQVRRECGCIGYRYNLPAE